MNIRSHRSNEHTVTHSHKSAGDFYSLEIHHVLHPCLFETPYHCIFKGCRRSHNQDCRLCVSGAYEVSSRASCIPSHLTKKRKESERSFCQLYAPCLVLEPPELHHIFASKVLTLRRQAIEYTTLTPAHDTQSYKPTTEWILLLIFSSSPIESSGTEAWEDMHQDLQSFRPPTDVSAIRRFSRSR